MNKDERTYIYDVEECTIKVNGDGINSVHNYFSTYDKAVAYIGWVTACVESNGGRNVINNFFDSKYELPSGEYYTIKCEKRLLDAFQIGES